MNHLLFLTRSLIILLLSFSSVKAQQALTFEDENCKIELEYSKGKKKKWVSITKVNESDSILYIYGEKDRYNYRRLYKKQYAKVGSYAPEYIMDRCIWVKRYRLPSTHPYFPVLSLQPGEKYTEKYVIKNDTKVENIKILERYWFEHDFYAFSRAAVENDMTNYGNPVLADKYSKTFSFEVRFRE